MHYSHSLAILAVLDLQSDVADKNQISKSVFYDHHFDISDQKLDVLFDDLIKREFIDASRKDAKLVYSLTSKGRKQAEKIGKWSLDEITTSWRLLDVRMQQQLSQVGFANKLDIPWRTYQNYEVAQRQISTSLVRQLHKVFGINPLWLLTGEGEQN